MASEPRANTAIECIANLPDDQLEDGLEIIRPGGMGVANVIAELLEKLGAVVTEPSLDFEHGWEFFAMMDGRRFWVLVTDLEQTKLIQTRDVSSLIKRLFAGCAAYDDFLKLLHQLLIGDGRFQSIEWKSP